MRWLVLLACTALSACALQPAVQLDPEPLFDDAAFQPRSAPANTDVFALSDAMKRFLDTEIGPELRRRGRLEGFVDAIRNGKRLKLKYDSSSTRTAAEAFDARAGNCISLVIMTAALAKELGLPVYYQQVFSEETWSRDGGILFRSEHVNLTLQPRLVDDDNWGDQDRRITIDFLPSEDVRGYRTRDLAERTVIAMFMNNRAAESLARGQLNSAYWWAREAILRDNGFLDAYNTLGVVYNRHGNLGEAERVFRLLLQREPDNPTFMSNLAAVLGAAGQEQAAQLLLQKLQRIEPYPPFYFIDQAQLAMKRGDYETAIGLFKRELARHPDYHATQFGLAVAYFKLGNVASAREHLTAAMQDSTTPRDHDLYAAKLEWLRFHQTNERSTTRDQVQ
jgi:thioredoxin-like negative regulator of GroEL